MKKLFVRDLHASIGLSAESVFVLSAREQKLAKNERPYLDIELKDATGEVRGKVWSDAMSLSADAEVGDVVAVEFQVREYNGAPDLTIKSMKKTEEYQLEDLIQIPTNVAADQLKLELSRRVDSIRDFEFRQLVDAIFEDERLYEQFVTAPAGSFIHHAYRHGLLQHTLEVLTICDSFLKIYPDLDRDLLTTGALLHDIGKLREQKTSLSGIVSRTVEGNMVGHIVLGVEMILNHLPPEFPEHKKNQVIHLILSHHGTLEFGSPVMPCLREAFILHMADKASMDLNIVQRAIKDGKEGLSDDGIFSNYIKHLNTRIFLGPSED